MQRAHGALHRGEQVPLGTVTQTGRFGRMFPQLKPLIVDGTALDELAATMKDGQSGITAGDNRNIPACAMEVSRDGDYTELKPFEHPEPCGCYFELRATGSTSCESCIDSTTCPSEAPVCRHGYCEER